ncbi:cytidylyltransferase domain-containing protein [Planctomycetota bacterium]
MKVVGIIQARMASTRLPGKVLIPVVGQTLLAHQIERLEKCQGLNALAVATGDGEEDDPVAKECSRIGIPCFRGNPDDVLDRVLNAAKEYKAEAITHFTGNCPLIDPKISTSIIWHFLANTYKLVGCAGIIPEERTFPHGLDTEIFSMETLEEAAGNAFQLDQRQDVTAWIYDNYPQQIHTFTYHSDQSRHRWIVKTPEDLELIKSIYNHLYHGEHDFYLEDILAFLEDHPELAEISLRTE